MFDIFRTHTTSVDLPNNELHLSDLKSIRVLDPIIFSKFMIPAHKWILIKGPTGIGKTRFLKILAGVSSEDFIIRSEDFSQFSSREWEPDVSFVSQAPYLVGNSLLEMVSSDNFDCQSDEPALKYFMDVCSIDHELLDAQIDFLKLSGGQRKQIALLRALLTGKTFLVLDEFTAGLDFDLATQILSNLKGVDFLQTLIMSTHEELFNNWFDVNYRIS
jgi:ABC-type transport system involved in cytochrome bd biosynthesis fused ATPase/permease subunit